MSGLIEIQRWVAREVKLKKFTDVNTAYEYLNDPNNFDWRNDLDDILLDDKPKFLEFLKSQITQPTQFDPVDTFEFREVRVRGYQYYRNNKLIQVSAHIRRIKIK